MMRSMDPNDILEVDLYYLIQASEVCTSVSLQNPYGANRAWARLRPAPLETVSLLPTPSMPPG